MHVSIGFWGAPSSRLNKTITQHGRVTVQQTAVIVQMLRLNAQNDVNFINWMQRGSQTVGLLRSPLNWFPLICTRIYRIGRYNGWIIVQLWWWRPFLEGWNVYSIWTGLSTRRFPVLASTSKSLITTVTFANLQMHRFFSQRETTNSSTLWLDIALAESRIFVQICNT